MKKLKEAKQLRVSFSLGGHIGPPGCVHYPKIQNMESYPNTKKNDVNRFLSTPSAQASRSSLRDNKLVSIH